MIKNFLLCERLWCHDQEFCIVGELNCRKYCNNSTVPWELESLSMKFQLKCWLVNQLHMVYLKLWLQTTEDGVEGGAGLGYSWIDTYMLKRLKCGHLWLADTTWDWSLICSHFAQSAGGRLQLDMHTPLTQWNQRGLPPGIVWKRSRETCAHATHQGTLVPSHLSPLSHLGLIFGLKEWNWCTQVGIHKKQQQKSTGRE